MAFSLHMLCGLFTPLSSKQTNHYQFHGQKQQTFHSKIMIFLICSRIRRTNRFDAPLKVAFLFALPALFGIWLGLSIAGSVLVGVGYGFFTPWVSAFEAFRHDNESKKFFHCIVVIFNSGLPLFPILLWRLHLWFFFKFPYFYVFIFHNFKLSDYVNA